MRFHSRIAYWATLIRLFLFFFNSIISPNMANFAIESGAIELFELPWIKDVASVIYY
jgi:hypothetical protein